VVRTNAPTRKIKCESVFGSRSNGDAPGGCQQRTLMMCNQGPYTVLKSENMPTAGDARSVRGPAAVVIRCG